MRQQQKVAIELTISTSSLRRRRLAGAARSATASPARPALLLLELLHVHLWREGHGWPLHAATSLRHLLGHLLLNKDLRVQVRAAERAD